MKPQKKLFENVEGNRFKLLTESLDNPSELVSSGLRKVFSNGHPKISYSQIETVGLGYIKDINEAKRVALNAARKLIKEYGYKDQEEEKKFVKDSANTLPLKKEVQNETGEEEREVQIGKEILSLLGAIYKNNPELHADNDSGPTNDLRKIEKLARELLKLHGGEVA